MKVSQLKKNKANPRQIKGEKLELLKKSVGSFQKMMELRPMIVDEDFVVLGGNMRLAAIKALGLKEIPDTWVRQVTDLTDDEKKEFIIKDNNSFGEYDWDAIANEWSDLPLADWGLDVPGFEAIDEPEGDADAEPQIDKAAELNKKWKVKSGDLWQIGEHRLLCGSSTEQADTYRLLEGKKAEMCFTDPPYNVQIDYGKYDDNQNDEEYRSFSGAWLTIARDIAPQVLFTPGFGRGLGMPNIQMWYAIAPPDWVIVWVKTNAMSRSSLGGFNNWEPIFFYGKHQKTLPQDIFDIPITVQKDAADEDGTKYHPTPKSVKLWSNIIKTLTDSGNSVYEPFAGSGTTLVACQNLNRKCYAIEISENYCAVILERMQTAFPDIEIKRIENAKTKGTT